MSRSAHASYRTTGRPSSDQSDVWREVHRKLGKMGSCSPSDALEQAYEDNQGKLQALIREVHVPEGCNGVVFAFGGSIAGADLFDKPETLSKLFPKLVKAYALDALEEPDTSESVDRETVTTWLRSAGEAPAETFKSPGLGTDVRIEGRGTVGASLVVEQQPVHTELFNEATI